MYKLNLPDSMKIARIRHVSVLEPADPGAVIMENVPDINSKSQKKVWEVKKILNLKLINNNERKYLVK